MRGIDDYFGAAGDMFSGSQDPEEQNRAAERETERKRREQARLLREQQFAQAELQKSLQQTTPKPLLKINPDDPLDGVPDEKRQEILLHKYDNGNRKPTDYLGGEMSRDRQNEYIDVWKNRVRNSDEDMRYILLHQSMKYDPNVKKQVEQAKRQFQEWLPIPEAQTLEFRLDGKDHPSNAYRTLEYRPERDGVPSIQNAIQYANEPVKVVKTDNNFLSQIMSVNDPQDQSVMPAYRRIGQILVDAISDAFKSDKAVTGYGRNTVGHSDLSSGSFYEVGKKNMNPNSGLGKDSTVHGKDGSRIAGTSDQSNPLLVTGFQNMDHRTFGKAQEMINEAQGFKYDREYGSQESYAFVKGMKMVPLEAKIGIYSLASLGGELLYSIIGGDPKGMRQAQQQLKTYQQQLDAMEPMKLDRIVDPDHPENTSRNLTLYLYQNLGNQLVKLPASVLLGKVDSIATLTGISAATMTAKIHADLQKKTGDPHAVESLMYGVPLGMMTLLNIPFKVPSSVKSPEDVKKWVTSIGADFAMGEIKDSAADYAVNQYENFKKDDKDPSQ